MNNKTIILLILLIYLLACSCSIVHENNSGSNETKNDSYYSLILNNNHFGGNILFYGIDPNRDNNSLVAFTNTFNSVGMEITRFDLYWGRIEIDLTNDIFDWTLPDELLSTIDQSTPVLFTLYSTNRWGSKYQEYKPETNYNAPPSSPPIDMQDYMNFLEKIVNKYKNRVKYWQIENEVYGASKKEEEKPPYNNFWIGTKEEYVNLLKASYTKIKEIDPDAIVFGSSIAFGAVWPNPYLPHEFLDYTLDEAKNHMDLIDLHQYGSVYNVTDKIKTIKDKISNLGYIKPLWCTESGEIDIRVYTDSQYDNFRNTFDDPEELKIQSEEIIKRHVFAFANGIEKVFRLRLNPYKITEYPISNWPHMSLTLDKYGVEKKPGFYTYKIMTSKLKNFITAKILENKDNDKFIIAKFDFNNKKSVFVLWSDTEKSVDLSPYIPSEQVIVTHIVTDVNNQKEEDILQTNSVTLNNTPIFVEEM